MRWDAHRAGSHFTQEAMGELGRAAVSLERV
jgi:hypothetical protein